MAVAIPRVSIFKVVVGVDVVIVGVGFAVVIVVRLFSSVCCSFCLSSFSFSVLQSMMRTSPAD